MKKVKTVKGKDIYKKGFRVFHVWGKMPDGEIVSKYYATKNPVKLLKAHPQRNIYIDVASYQLTENYEIFK